MALGFDVVDGILSANEIPTEKTNIAIQVDLIKEHANSIPSVAIPHDTTVEKANVAIQVDDYDIHNL